MIQHCRCFISSICIIHFSVMSQGIVSVKTDPCAIMGEIKGKTKYEDMERAKQCKKRIEVYKFL